MKVGDLVRYGSTTPDNRTPIQKIVGTVIGTDGIMTCSMGVVILVGEPIAMGRVEVLWPDERMIEKEVFASLEVVNESR